MQPPLIDIVMLAMGAAVSVALFSLFLFLIA